MSLQLTPAHSNWSYFLNVAQSGLIPKSIGFI